MKNDRFARTFIHTPTDMPVLNFNNICESMEAFHAALDEIDNDKHVAAFGADSYIEENNNSPSPIITIKRIVNDDVLSDELKIDYYYHDLLNYPSLSIMLSS